MSGGEFTVDLPMPPSVNTMFVQRRAEGKTGRSLSPEYKRWRDAAGLMLKAAWRRAGSPQITAPWGYEMRFNLDHGSDISNRAKAPEDLLVKGKITPGDQWMNDGRVIRDRTIPQLTVRIRVFSM